jgi:hypothetical protein
MQKGARILENLRGGVSFWMRGAVIWGYNECVEGFEGFTAWGALGSMTADLNVVDEMAHKKSRGQDIGDLPAVFLRAGHP